MDFVDGIVEVGVVDDIFVTDLARVEIIGGDTIRYTLTARQQSETGETINIVKARMIWSYQRRMEVDEVFARAAREIHARIGNALKGHVGAH